MEFSTAQKNRLSELGISDDIAEKDYPPGTDMAKLFHRTEMAAVKENKARISGLINERHKPALISLMDSLSEALCKNGFTQVATPTIISSKALAKMTITPSEPLYDQVFWLDSKTALRPMLAPGLYEVSRQLIPLANMPLRVFEIGSCFRKESEGKSHLKEFTMLNLVEWGTPMEDRVDTLKKFAKIVMEAADISDYKFEEEESTVYGTGLDLVSSDGLELASSSMGPHPLDDAWKINCTWVGIGFGLERLLKFREGKQGIKSFGRSTVFLDGACLKVR